MQQIIMNMNIEDDYYDWENEEIEYDFGIVEQDCQEIDDLYHEDRIDIADLDFQAVTNYVKELPQPKIPTPVIHTAEELAEIEIVKTKLVWCSKPAQRPEHLKYASDSESEDEDERKTTCKLVMEFPSLIDSVGVKVVKPNNTVHQKRIEHVPIEHVPVAYVPSNSLRKTRMCYNGEKCPREHCDFAHRPEELVFKPCNFGGQCYTVKFYRGHYINFSSKGDICMYIHPEEKPEDCCVRTKIIKRSAPTETEMDDAFNEYNANPKLFSGSLPVPKPINENSFEILQVKPQKTVIVEKSRSQVEESLESLKIREKNEILNRIREVNVSNRQKSETLGRFKNMRNKTNFQKTQIIKLEELISVNEKELVKLNERLKNVPLMKKPEKKEVIVPVKIVPVKAVTKNVVSEEKQAPRVSVFLQKPVVLNQVKADEDRSNILKTLESVKKTRKNLEKTRMCNLTPCTRAVCTFAHSKTDLKISMCIFGDLCKFVAKTSDGFVNKSSKPCMDRHPEEHINNFYYRVGIDKVPVRTRPFNK